jgi:hypothetical protein
MVILVCFHVIVKSENPKSNPQTTCSMFTNFSWISLIHFILVALGQICIFFVLKMTYVTNLEERNFAVYFPANVYFSILKHYLFLCISYFKLHCDILRKNKPWTFLFTVCCWKEDNTEMTACFLVMRTVFGVPVILFQWLWSRIG